MSILVLSKRGVSSHSSHGICSREGPPTRQTPESFNHTCLLTRQFDNRSHSLTGQLLRCWWCWCQVPPSKLPKSIFELHMLLEPAAFFRLQRLSLAKRKALQWNLYEHSKFCDKLWASNCVSKWTSCYFMLFQGHSLCQQRLASPFRARHPPEDFTYLVRWATKQNQ